MLLLFLCIKNNFLKLLTFLEELYKIKTIEGKKEKSEVIQMIKMLKTLGAVYIYIYIS